MIIQNLISLNYSIKYSKNLCFILISLLFGVVSCSNHNQNDIKYRNPNYIWFESDENTNGEWIELEKEGDDFLKNGSYKMFYLDGNIFESGHFDSNGDYDTAFYYDTKGLLTHYCVNTGESVITNIVQNKPFKAYATSGELLITGKPVLGKLTEIKFHNDLENFIKVWCIYKNSQVKINNSFQELTVIIKDLIDNPNADTTKAFNSADSINKVLIKHLNFQGVLLSVTTVNQSNLDVKAKVTNYIQFQNGFAKNKMRKIILRCKNGLSDDERVKSKKELELVSNKNYQMNEKLKGAIREALAPYFYQDYLFEFIDTATDQCLMDK